MSTLKCTNVQHASAASAAITLASDGSAAATLSSLNGGPLSGARNRIINGDMRLDQRNAGASVTPTGNAYTLDRWSAGADVASKYSIQQVSDAPSGFAFSAKITSLSAYTVGSTETFGLFQYIEGFNSADLVFGTASAKTITVSFWVKSSLTGTFGGSIQNSGYTRSYPFSYTISAANTWEQKSVTIPGDTTGTWVGATNGQGILLYFSVGSGSSRANTAGAWTGTQYSFGATGATSVVGTNGATFYITGVQLEAGSVATPFERRSYSIEQLLCARYYHTNVEIGTLPSKGGGSYFDGVIASVVNSGTTESTAYRFPVPMRTVPTISIWTPNNGTAGQAWSEITQANVAFSVAATSKQLANGANPTGSAISGNRYYFHYAANAEL